MKKKIVSLVIILGLVIGFLGIPQQASANMSATFTPVADGHVARVALAGESWWDITRGVGTLAQSGAPSIAAYFISSAGVGNKWAHLYRGEVVFDTSPIPDDQYIVSASLSLYGNGKQDNLDVSPNVGIYSSSSSGNSITLADYEASGTTLLSSTVPYNSQSASGYVFFALNTQGLAWISKTGLTRFTVRNANYDATGQEPNNISQTSYWAFNSRESGAATAPKLTIVYSTEETAPPPEPTPTPIPSSTSIQTKWLSKQLYQKGIKPMVAGNFVIESTSWIVPSNIRIVGFEMFSHIGFVDIVSQPFVKGIVDSQVLFSKGLYTEPDKIISFFSDSLRHWEQSGGMSTDSKQHQLHTVNMFPTGYGIDIDAGGKLYLYVGIRNGMTAESTGDGHAGEAAINGDVIIYYVER